MSLFSEATVEGLASGQPLRVVGLDLSLTGSGVVVLDEDGTASIQTFSSKGTKTDDLASRRARLQRLAGQIVGTVKEANPTLVAIEAPAFSKILGHAHDRSGLWWLVVHNVMALGFPLVEIQPNLRAKYATGKGNSGKDEVLISVTRRYPDLEAKNNNEADAVVLAHMGFHGLNRPLDDLPQVNLHALDTIRWPNELETQRG